LTALLSPHVGVAGEVSGSHRREDVSGTTERLDIGFHSVMVGPRFDLQPASRIAGFGHLLVGIHASRVSFAGFSTTLNDFAIQPGVGLDIRTASAIGFRIAADYRRVFAEPGRLDQFRFHTGVVIALGTR
jgi:hypothetical protein